MGELDDLAFSVLHCTVCAQKKKNKIGIKITYVSNDTADHLDIFTMPGPPIALQINCGFARVAIKELTPSNRSNLNELARMEQFRDIFSMLIFKLNTELFQLDNKGQQPFDRKCDMILESLRSKWHPTAKRMEYISTFSIQNWKSLSQAQQAMHTLASCEGCYYSYKELQEAFPGKPMFIVQPQIVELPETPSTS